MLKINYMEEILPTEMLYKQYTYHFISLRKRPLRTNIYIT
jgi:hypothetical protein